MVMQRPSNCSGGRAEPLHATDVAVPKGCWEPREPYQGRPSGYLVAGLPPGCPLVGPSLANGPPVMNGAQRLPLVFWLREPDLNRRLQVMSLAREPLLYPAKLLLGRFLLRLRLRRRLDVEQLNAEVRLRQDLLQLVG